MIVEIEGESPRIRPMPRWLLPAIPLVCAATLVAAFVAQRPPPVPHIDPGSPAAAALPPPLRFPPAAARLVSVGPRTAIGPSGEPIAVPGALLVYEVPDGRRVTLVQLPPHATLSGEPEVGVVDTATLRGAPATVVRSGTVRQRSNVVRWTEGGATYQLAAVAVSADELLRLAVSLR
ncbi:MAG TPA: hypothetical protein VMJ92_04990 [Candidatus Limnocylindrales bacterium]|nr:hypothetical protein [Candidatus Limnocylindrales bacterium]